MRHPVWLLKVAVFSLLILPVIGHAELSGDAILAKVDRVFESPTSVLEITMTTIDAAHSEKSSQILIYTKKDATGRKRTLIQYLAPVEDQGIKFLALGGAEQLWMYLPQIKKTIRISGAMAKQSMMNSDFSYEDLLDRDRLGEDYAARLLGEEDIEAIGCYVLELQAKKGSAHYRQMKLWARRDNFIPIREEFYSGSGKLQKTAVQTDIVKIHGRLVPTRMIFRDLELQDHQTTLSITKMRFGVVIPERYFTVENLTKDK